MNLFFLISSIETNCSVWLTLACLWMLFSNIYPLILGASLREAKSTPMCLRVLCGWLCFAHDPAPEPSILGPASPWGLLNFFAPFFFSISPFSLKSVWLFLKIRVFHFGTNMMLLLQAVKGYFEIKVYFHAVAFYLFFPNILTTIFSYENNFEQTMQYDRHNF